VRFGKSGLLILRRKMKKSKINGRVMSAKELVKRIKEPHKRLISDNPKLLSQFRRVREQLRKQGLLGKRSLIIA